jgi:hypothetical protein
MYFAISPDGFSGYGETIEAAIKDLEEKDSGNSLNSLDFYKAQRIFVEIVEKPTAVEAVKFATKTATAKTKR